MKEWWMNKMMNEWMNEFDTLEYKQRSKSHLAYKSGT